MRALLYDVDRGREVAHGLGPDDASQASYVSEVVPAPGGPVVVVDAADLPGRALGRLLEALAARLELEGLDDGVVTAPKTGGPLDVLPEPPDCVALHVCPPSDYQPRGIGELPTASAPGSVA